MCLTKGILFINHSPIQKTVAPTHDEANIPIKNTKISDVINPRPARTRSIQWWFPYSEILDLFKHQANQYQLNENKEYYIT